MGVIVEVTCASCGAKWQCKTGCGIMHGELGQAAGEFPEAIRKEIETDAGTEIPLFDFQYRLSACKHCGSIESVPVLKLLRNEQEYCGLCAECGQKSELIEDIEKTPCPVCHEEALVAEEIGMWD